MATVQTRSGVTTPDKPFTQLTFDDRKHEARAILVRMFMFGLHPDDDPDMLWNRLCDLGGLKQASLLAGGTQWHIPEKFDIILDQHLYAADEGSILAEFQLGQYYAARDPVTDIPRDEQSARMWLNRALANTSAEDDTIFGALHYKRLALDELAKLDIEPMPVNPMAETAAVESQVIPALPPQGVVTTISPPVAPITSPPAASPDVRAKRLAEKFALMWIVAGAIASLILLYASGSVPCLPNPYLAPEARMPNALCPTAIPLLHRALAVIASYGMYAIIVVVAAFLLFNVTRRGLRADPKGSAIFAKVLGVILTLCCLPVVFLCHSLFGNLVLGWLLG